MLMLGALVLLAIAPILNNQVLGGAAFAVLMLVALFSLFFGIGRERT